MQRDRKAAVIVGREAERKLRASQHSYQRPRDPMLDFLWCRKMVLFTNIQYGPLHGHLLMRKHVTMCRNLCNCYYLLIVHLQNRLICVFQEISGHTGVCGCIFLQVFSYAIRNSVSFVISFLCGFPVLRVKGFDKQAWQLGYFCLP